MWTRFVCLWRRKGCAGRAIRGVCGRFRGGAGDCEYSKVSSSKIELSERAVNSPLAPFGDVPLIAFEASEVVIARVGSEDDATFTMLLALPNF
jgi:hypothetical protein